MRPALRPAAAVQTHEHGQYIYAYSHVRTNQVLYSLKRTLDGQHSLKQLPDIGANDAKAEGRLRRDLWRPFFSVAFPPTPPDRLSPHGSNSNAQGLHAYRQLREWRLLHEYHWTPPASLAMPYTEEQKKELKERYDKRGGSKKETVYDIIKREKKKIRRREVQDQKANSVADLAAVLQEQANAGVEMELQSEKDRSAKVKNILRLAKKTRKGEVKTLEVELRKLQPYLARREGFRIEDGAKISQRQAKRRAWQLEMQIARMRFAAEAVHGIRELLDVLDRVEQDLQSQIDALQDGTTEAAHTSKFAPAQTEKTDEAEQANQSAQLDVSDAEPTVGGETQITELKAILAGAREARSEILNYGHSGLAMVKEWIDDDRNVSMSNAENSASQPADTADNPAQEKDAESNLSGKVDETPAVPKSAETEPSVASTVETETSDPFKPMEVEDAPGWKKEIDGRIKGYELVLTAILKEPREREARKREEEEEKARKREEEETETRKRKEERKEAAAARKKEKERLEQMTTPQQRFRDAELYLPEKVKELDFKIAELEQISEPSASEQARLIKTREHRDSRNAHLETFREVDAIRSNTRGSAVAGTLERRLLESTKSQEAERDRQIVGERPTKEFTLLTAQTKILRLALGAERNWRAADIQVDTEKNTVDLIEPRVWNVEEQMKIENDEGEASYTQGNGSAEVTQETVETVGGESTSNLDTRDEILRATWLPILPSFPTELTPPEKVFSKRHVRLKKREIRRHRAALFTMKGVKVKFNNVLDAEFAEEWPEDVEIEGMGLTKGMSMPKADDVPIFGEVEWREKLREPRRARKAIIDELTNEVVRAVSKRANNDAVKAEETQVVMKEEAPLIVEEEKPVVVREAQPVVVEEDKPLVPEGNEEPVAKDEQKAEEPMIPVEDRSSAARRGLGTVRGWFGR